MVVAFCRCGHRLTLGKQLRERIDVLEHLAFRKAHIAEQPSAVNLVPGIAVQVGPTFEPITVDVCIDAVGEWCGGTGKLQQVILRMLAELFHKCCVGSWSHMVVRVNKRDVVTRSLAYSGITRFAQSSIRLVNSLDAPVFLRPFVTTLATAVR